MNNKKYVIIEASDVSTVNFDEVLQTSVDTLLYNRAGDQFIVKYEGNKPRCLYGKDALDYNAICEVLSGEAWSEPKNEEE